MIKNTSIIQILKVGAVVEKSYEGRKYNAQDLECAILTDSGDIEQVGVWKTSDKFRTANPVINAGQYTAGFSIEVNNKTRQIGAVLTSLVPLPQNYFKSAQKHSPTV